MYPDSDSNLMHTPIILQTPNLHTFLFQPPTTQTIKQSIDYSIDQSTIWAIGSADSQPGTLVIMFMYECGKEYTRQQHSRCSWLFIHTSTTWIHKIHTECIPGTPTDVHTDRQTSDSISDWDMNPEPLTHQTHNRHTETHKQRITRSHNFCLNRGKNI